jgi:putative peptidoglycan lipid II flippase
MFSGFYFDYSATGLSGGSLTAISFAQKIYILPISFLAIPILEILSTKFALLYASNELGKIQDLYKQMVDMTLFIMVPVSAVLIGYGDDIVQILFGRGAFTKESIAITASSLSIYAVAIPFIVLFQLNGRITLTLQKTKLASVLGSFGHFFMICVTWWAVNEFNYIGIPLAKAGVELVYFFPFGMLCIYFYLGGVDFRLLFFDAFKTILFAFMGILLASKSCSFIFHYYTMSNFYLLIFNLSLFFPIYYLLCRFGKIKSLKLMENILYNFFIKKI